MLGLHISLGTQHFSSDSFIGNYSNGIICALLNIYSAQLEVLYKQSKAVKGAEGRGLYDSALYNSNNFIDINIV